MLSQDPLAKNAPRLNPKKWILHGQFQTISLSFHYYALRTATRHLLPTYWFPASSSTKLHFLRFLRMFYKVWKEICFLMKDIWIFGLKLDIWKKTNHCTLFENYSKCPIWIFEIWHFPTIFVLLKLTCLITLFDRKLQVFKDSPNWTIFWHFSLTFVHSKCKLSSLRSQCWMRLFLWFSNKYCGKLHIAKIESCFGWRLRIRKPSSKHSPAAFVQNNLITK